MVVVCEVKWCCEMAMISIFFLFPIVSLIIPAIYKALVLSCKVYNTHVTQIAWTPPPPPLLPRAVLLAAGRLFCGVREEKHVKSLLGNYLRLVLRRENENIGKIEIIKKILRACLEFFFIILFFCDTCPLCCSVGVVN